MASLIGQLRVSLGLDTAAFEKGATRAEARARSLGDRAEGLGFKVGRMGKALFSVGAVLAGGAIFSGIARLIESHLEAAGAIGETAQKLGVTTKTLQEYTYAATQAGMSQEAMENTLGKLTRSLGEAANGASKPATAFAKLGIDIKAFIASGKDSGDLLPLIAEGLKGLGSESERAAVKAAILGRGWQEAGALLANGAAGVNNLRDAAHKMGLVLTKEQIDNADKAADEYTTLKNVLSIQITSFVAANAKEIQALVRTLLDFAKAAVTALNAWNKFRGASGRIEKAWATIDANPNLNEWQKRLAKSTARQEINRQEGITTESVGGWAGAIGVKRSTVGKANFAGGFSGGFGNSLMQQMASITPGLLKDGLAEISRNTNSAQVAVEDMVIGIGSAMRRLATAMAEPATEAAEDTGAAFRALAADAAMMFDQLFPEVAEMNRLALSLEKIDQFLAAGLVTIEQATEMRRRLREGVEQATAVHQQLGNLTGAANDNADDIGAANVRIVRSFQDMAQQTMSTVQALTGAIKGGGFLDILGAVINLGLQLGSIGLFGQGIADKINLSPGGSTRKGNNNPTPRASGGPIDPGRLYMVGERGPELFVSGSKGRVVPNHALGSAPSRIEVIPSPYFDLVVDGRVMRAAPGIAMAGAQGGLSRMKYSQSRRVR